MSPKTLSKTISMILLAALSEPGAASTRTSSIEIPTEDRVHTRDVDPSTLPPCTAIVFDADFETLRAHPDWCPPGTMRETVSERQARLAVPGGRSNSSGQAT